MGFAAGWNGLFNELKSNETEQPQWYGFRRYGVMLFLMHHFGFLL
ncbi:hypothetical protein B4168_1050 [Anoxybacillus flavithermus]|nr:hypothetical protein B4168_1050 [Anoxybacillus flavithermus]OAO88307.1 hypothetical protein GT23_0583 [Parageobacillus thermoglucosidasius]